ncbi:MAG: hypothetical protein NT150_07265 [Bacteroidetes bacterium]|nr:hypothetical protein [Bacteroidota bacterium]
MIKKISSKRKIRLMGTFGMLLSCGTVFAGNPTDSIQSAKDSLELRENYIFSQSRKIPFAGTTTLMLNPTYSQYEGKKLNDYFGSMNQGKALFGDDVVISGVMRALVVYRDMQKSYDDMITSEKSIAFSDYPTANISTANGGGYPMLELNISSKYKSKIDFNVGYSLSPIFTGDVQNGGSRSISARQNINFSGRIRNGLFETSITAGEVLWVKMSKFTMGQAEYRDNYFNRLPWDWYRRSFERFEEYFSQSTNIGNQGLGGNAVTGVVYETNYLPWQVGVRGMFGRTSSSVNISEGINFFPSYTGVVRLEKVVFERFMSGMAGLNFYAKRAQVGFEDKRPDNNTVTTLDFNFKIKKVLVSGEFGLGKIVNPGSPSSNPLGQAYYFKTEFDKRIVLVPFSVEYYNINKGMASLDGSILNSNPTLSQGGYGTEKVYDALYLPNIAQEVGQIANNRQGVNFRAEGGIGKYVRVQFGYAFSGEKENISNQITIQHRVNDFSRSRMRPWFQANGPYHRVKSSWFRTYETITIDTAKAGSGYLKGFNAAELLLKGQFNIGKHKLVVLNYNSFNSVQKGFSPLPSMDSKTMLINVFYEDLTVAFSLLKNLSVVGEVGFETVKGSTMVDLSPDKPTAADEDRVINQLGKTVAFGIDYDISRNMNIHLRRRYFTHSDTNFTKDVFQGNETTFEFKIFF